MHDSRVSNKIKEQIAEYIRENQNEPIDMKKPNIDMLLDNILLIADPKPATTEGGLDLNAAFVKVPDKGIISAAGPGKRVIDSESKQAIDMGMKVSIGDRVVYATQGTTTMNLDGIEYVLLKEENVLGILPSNE